MDLEPLRCPLVSSVWFDAVPQGSGEERFFPKCQVRWSPTCRACSVPVSRCLVQPSREAEGWPFSMLVVPCGFLGAFCSSGELLPRDCDRDHSHPLSAGGYWWLTIPITGLSLGSRIPCGLGTTNVLCVHVSLPLGVPSAFGLEDIHVHSLPRCFLSQLMSPYFLGLKGLKIS